MWLGELTIKEDSAQILEAKDMRLDIGYPCKLQECKKSKSVLWFEE